MAGYPRRLAMKGRRVSEVSSRARPEPRSARRRRVARRLRAMVRRQLDTLDLGRRLGAIRTRLVAARRPPAGADRGRGVAQVDAALRNCASRLETLSPLAVLARGYAVCWNADRTRALRDAADVAPATRSTSP